MKMILLFLGFVCLTSFANAQWCMSSNQFAQFKFKSNGVIMVKNKFII